LLLIPMSMIESVIYERNHLYLSAKQDIMNSWGREQTIGGPVLTLPYRVIYTDDKGIKRVRQSFAHFLPEHLSVRGQLDTQMRYRGIYQVPVYVADLKIRGRFAPPDLARLGIDAQAVDWDEAYLSVAIADARGIKDPMTLRSDVGDGTFEPGGVKVPGFDPQVIVPVKGLGKAGEPAGFRFAFDLKLSGTEKLAFLPTGDRTDVLMKSGWPSPSFTGAYLPSRRDIDNKGFSAEWKVLHLGRSYPSEWRNGEVPAKRIANSAFGVNLFVPVSTYQKSTRAAKYAILFIGLSFLAYFMFEVFGNLHLHPFQYLLVGFANCLFYLLLLSLSEHIDFALAYTLSAAASTALVVGYSMSILENRSHVLTMLALLAGLYTFLYVTLRAEQYAMLIGAVALFVILATVMYLTRRLDWYRVTLDFGPDWPSPRGGSPDQATRTV
ncbi:MAG: cell envelope integrity protein CreD, partial [Gemmatimonadales bacterium]